MARPRRAVTFRSGITQVRLSGDPVYLTALIEHLTTRYLITGATHAYPNRGTAGVRVYLTAQPLCRCDYSTQLSTGPAAGPVAVRPGCPLHDPNGKETNR